VKPLILFMVLLSPCVFAQELVFVFLHHRTDAAELPKEQLDKIMAGHMANIRRLAKEGKLLVAGPFESGGGIFIFNSSSVNEVSQWLKTDPGVQANRWNLEVLPYHWVVGKPRLVNDPFEMTDYNFIRFVPSVVKFNINDVPALFKKHDGYLKELEKTSNIIAEGAFGDVEGGILVIKGDLNKKIIEADPAVYEGLLKIEIKKWFVAKGAFGEP
jgi:uncharacterized protein YciI